jgi:hypothetical protein
MREWNTVMARYRKGAAQPSPRPLDILIGFRTRYRVSVSHQSLRQRVFMDCSLFDRLKATSQDKRRFIFLDTDYE